MKTEDMNISKLKKIIRNLENEVIISEMVKSYLNSMLDIPYKYGPRTDLGRLMRKRINNICDDISSLHSNIVWVKSILKERKK